MGNHATAEASPLPPPPPPPQTVTVTPSLSRTSPRDLPNVKTTTVGFQIYIKLDTKRQDLDYVLDHPLSQTFSKIFDELWETDVVHVLRARLTTAINPTPFDLAIALKGVLWPVDEVGDGDDDGKALPIKLPAYLQGCLNKPLYEIRRCSTTPHEYDEYMLNPTELELEFIWSFNDVTAMDLKKWMQQETKSIVCLSIFLDLTYIVRSMRTA